MYPSNPRSTPPDHVSYQYYLSLTNFAHYFMLPIQVSPPCPTCPNNVPMSQVFSSLSPPNDFVYPSHVLDLNHQLSQHHRCISFTSCPLISAIMPYSCSISYVCVILLYIYLNAHNLLLFIAYSSSYCPSLFIPSHTLLISQSPKICIILVFELHIPTQSYFTNLANWKE